MAGGQQENIYKPGGCVAYETRFLNFLPLIIVPNPVLKLLYVDTVEYSNMCFWRSEAAQKEKKKNDNGKREQQENYWNQCDGWTNLWRYITNGIGWWRWRGGRIKIIL